MKTMALHACGRHNAVVEETEEDLICSDCNGSGEGQYDGTICHTCHGGGTLKERIIADTLEHDEFDDRFDLEHDEE
jgi:RecJ-like exonuclease